MECPKCHTERPRVVNTRMSRGLGVYRSRRCRKCAHRWTTYEIGAADLPAEWRRAGITGKAHDNICGEMSRMAAQLKQIKEILNGK